MKVKILYLAFLMLFLPGCDEIVKDEEVPQINMSGPNDFPQNCAKVYRGEAFVFSATLTDNTKLGSYSIEMHHNFDHHTHSTSGTSCEMEEVKSPVNPFVFIEEYEIPAGLTSYAVQNQIVVPANVDTGDYHITVRLTDKSGWQTFKGIAVKVANR